MQKAADERANTNATAVLVDALAVNANPPGMEDVYNPNKDATLFTRIGATRSRRVFLDKTKVGSIIPAERRSDRGGCRSLRTAA